MIRHFALALALATAGPAVAATVAATPATFAAAIAAAAPGDVVALAPGTYPYAYIRGPHVWSPAITVDAGAPGVVAAGFRFDGATGVRIRGVHLDAAAAGCTGPTCGSVQFQHSSNVAVLGFFCRGAPRNCVGIGNSDHVTILDGWIANAGSDGIDVAGSNHVEIGRILCEGGDPTAGAHPDCVQLYSKGDQYSPGATSTVVVHDSTAVGATQGFTMAGNNIPADHVEFRNLHYMGIFTLGIHQDSYGGCTPGCVLTGSGVERAFGASHIVQLTVDARAAAADNSGNSTRP